MAESAQGDLRKVIEEAMEKWHRCVFCDTPMRDWGKRPLCWWPDGDGHMLGQKPRILVEHAVTVSDDHT